MLVAKVLLAPVLQKYKGTFIAMLLLLVVVTGRGQAVVITEVSNQAGAYEEWVELLVLTDNTDMRGWSIRDFGPSGPQTAVTFSPIGTFWQNMRAGTIIIIRNRNMTSCPVSFPEDVNSPDGYIFLGLNNVSVFQGGAGMGNCTSTLSMSFLGTDPQDIVQLLDASGDHVHAFGFRGDDVHWNDLLLLPTPRFRTGAGVGIENGQFGGISNVTSITDFNGIGNYTLTAGGTSGLAQDLTTQNYWRATREPVMTSQVITTSVVGNTVNLSWIPNPNTDPNPLDGTTGYIILRKPGPFVNGVDDPVDGTIHPNLTMVGGATVITHLPSTSNTYSDFISPVVGCGIEFYYRVYAYRYTTDENGVSSLERGRAYNQTNFAYTNGIKLNEPSLFNVTGGGSFCVGGSGVPIGLSNSETGVTYQLMIGSPPGSPVGPQLNGTGGPINFGIHTTAGTYTVIATKTPPGCSITMNGNAMILVNPLPAAPTGIVYHSNCLHPTTGAIDFNNLPIGNWTLNWIFNPGNIPGSTTGNGSSFALLGLAAPGTYTFTVIEPISGCSSGSSSFTINAPPPIPPEPITLDVTQPTCTVPTGTITVLGPLGGVQYQLDSGPFQPVGVVTFNGIIPGNHSITGRLTADTTCFLNSVNVMIAGVTIPAAPSVASPITYCVGATANPLSATVTGTNTLLWYTTATGGTGSAIAPTPSLSYGRNNILLGKPGQQRSTKLRKFKVKNRCCSGCSSGGTICNFNGKLLCRCNSSRIDSNGYRN